MPKVDQRSWNSRYKSIIHPKPRPKKPRRKRGKRAPYPKVKRPSGVLVDPLIATLQTRTNITTGSSTELARKVQLSSNVNCGPGYTRRDWSGVDTPDYWIKMSRRQKLPMNPYWVNRKFSEGSDYNWSRVSWPFLDEGQETCATIADTFWPSSQSDQVTDEATFKARTRLSNKVSDHDFNVGVVFGERKKTAALIETTAARIYKSARALKKGNLGEAYALWGLDSRMSPNPKKWKELIDTPPDKRLANHWLEYWFGWVPLLRDVESAASLLASHVTGDFYHEIARSSGKATRTWIVKRNPRDIAGNTPVMERHEQSCRIKYDVYYRLDSYARAALGQTGITNPSTVAWELMPYSFVVDWFVPVNKYLEGLMAFDGFELRSGSVSRLWEGKAWKFFDRDVLYPSGTTLLVRGTSFFHEVDYRRSTMPTWPSSVLPSFRDPLDKGPLWKVATSMALLRQVFGR